jgi:peptide/nickel transport system permease protein
MFKSTVWRVLLSDYVSLLGALLVIAMILLGVVGPVLSSFAPEEMHIPDRQTGPSRSYILGTDQFGRDIYTRIAHGARISLTIGITCTGAAALAGIIIGSVSGFFGGAIDEVLMRFIDILMAFPMLVLAIALIALLGPSYGNLIIVIAVTRVAQFARLVRSSVLSLKEREFVTAARVVGQTEARILLRHVLPSCITPVVVMASLSMATAISAEASLSFLGLGVQPPTPSWGGMLSEGRAYVLDAPWMVLFPGLAISLTTLGLNLVGDGLRDALDPKSRSLVRSDKT